MTLLSIDTATEYMGLCLQSPEKGELFLSARLGLKHAQSLLVWIERILDQYQMQPKDLEALVVNRGPGSFTGLRIGMATAKGMSQSLDIPMISLSALDCYGQSLDYFPGTIVPLIDAKKKRFYTRLYKNKEPVSDYLDLALEDIFEKQKSQAMLLTGPAAKAVFENHQKEGLYLDPYWNQSPANLLAFWGHKALEKNPKGDDLGQGPLYLRKSEAEIFREQKQPPV